MKADVFGQGWRAFAAPKWSLQRTGACREKLEFASARDRLRPRRRAYALLTAALLGCCAYALPSQAMSRQSALVGKPAPNFQLKGIYDESYSLDQFKGHILVMQFGSSW